LLKLRSSASLFPDNEVDIDGGVDLEGGDVLDHGGWAVDINNSLVDSHLESVPGVGSLSAWGLSHGAKLWKVNTLRQLSCRNDEPYLKTSGQKHHQTDALFPESNRHAVFKMG